MNRLEYDDHLDGYSIMGVECKIENRKHFFFKNKNQFKLTCRTWSNYLLKIPLLTSFPYQPCDACYYFMAITRIK